MARKVTCYFRLFSSVLVSVLRTSINVLSKSKSKNYVTWIANVTKLFLSVKMSQKMDGVKHGLNRGSHLPAKLQICPTLFESGLNLLSLLIFRVHKWLPRCFFSWNKTIPKMLYNNLYSEKLSRYV